MWDILLQGNVPCIVYNPQNNLVLYCEGGEINFIKGLFFVLVRAAAVSIEYLADNVVQAFPCAEVLIIFI